MQTVPGAVEAAIPIIGDCRRQAPNSPRKGMEEGTPLDSEGYGAPSKPSTSMISQPWDIPAALYAWLGRDFESLCLGNEDRDSTSGSVSALSSPGVGRASPKCSARGAGPMAGFGAQSQGHSSVGPVLVETSAFWPPSSWVQRWDGDAQLVGCFEATQSLAFGGEPGGTQRRRVVCGRMGPAGEDVWPHPGQLEVSLPHPAAGRPRPLVGVGKESWKGCTDS